MQVKEIVIWIIVFIIGSLIVTFLVSPNSFNNFKSNIKNILSYSNTQGDVNNVKNTEDTLITSCRNSFNECNNIVNQKFNQKYSLIKIEKFEDLNGASAFFKTWQTFAVPITDDFVSAILPVYCGGNCSQSLPLVLITIKVTSPEGVTISQVAFCDKTGKLTSYSKSQAGC